MNTDPTELVARADLAEDEGRVDDAIGLLSEANRARIDPAIEARLLRLRLEGARTRMSGPRPTTEQPWPPAVADPFPAVDGLPEIAPAQLDETTLGGAILHHGALVVRGFASSAAADELRSAIDDALAEHAARDDGTSDVRRVAFRELDAGPDAVDLAVARAFTHGLGGGLLSVDAPHAFFVWMELVERSGLVDVLTTHLGERPVLSADKTTFRRLREAPDTSWHQDGSFMGPVRAVNLWLSLSHCGGDTGTKGLDVIPSRTEQLLDTGTHGARTAVAAIGSDLVAEAVTTPMTTPEFRPGDALCFDDRFLHRTSAADVDGVRHAIEAWFFAPSGFPAGYTPILV